MNQIREFSTQLRQLRNARGLTQEQLALELHISVTHEGKLENGSRTPSVDLLLQISDYFGVSLDQLLKGHSASSDDARHIVQKAIQELKKLEKLLREENPYKEGG